ncbi:TIGR01548 family HAD-type hydrolase [Candidatus Gottesmanbacteria bacterium]|nr:TIGR01548 family HAD-type hydrolase [Candidatus Gottesmanbacteria bacterium]
MKIDSVIFDMDGVLVDVTSSYRVAIEKTVNLFLGQKGLFVRVTQKDIAEIKNLPGFNNDWDATFVLIDLLSKRIKKEKLGEEVKTLKPINKQTREYKEIKDIFQVFYLGSLLYKKIEKRNPPLTNIRGLILDEKCLVSIELLEVLNNMKLKLGIVTGRPRKEALFAVKNFQLQDFFPEEYIVALEDAAKEKPFPDPLLKAKKRMRVEKPIYIGDTINDVIAARRANMPCVFVGKENLGDMQITNINHLQEVLL